MPSFTVCRDCEMFVSDDPWSQDTHVHKLPKSIHIEYDHKVCISSMGTGVRHADPCTCKERSYIDKLQEIVDMTWEFHDRRGGQHTLQWEDIDNVSLWATRLLRKLVNQPADRAAQWWKGERAKKRQRLDDQPKDGVVLLDDQSKKEVDVPVPTE